LLVQASYFRQRRGFERLKRRFIKLAIPPTKTNYLASFKIAYTANIYAYLTELHKKVISDYDTHF